LSLLECNAYPCGTDDVRLECNAYPCGTDDVRVLVVNPLAELAKGHCDTERLGIAPEDPKADVNPRMTLLVLASAPVIPRVLPAAIFAACLSSALM
jgi:hypothetical protein